MIAEGSIGWSSVLCGALVWERIMPGVISINHGAWAGYIIPQKLDRGGAINTIALALCKRDDGLVIINPTKCTGCRNCVDACPTNCLQLLDEDETQELIAKG